MVFSSLIFLIVFLPITVLLYHGLLRYGRLALASLFLASLVYYAYWKVENVWIVIASIVFNFLFGKLIDHQEKQSHRKAYFIVSVLVNLGLLAYFKYTDFIINSVNAVANTDIPLTGIILPIGISFFTFQQIAYTSDIYTRKFPAGNEKFLDYCLFVCFFPQLVAGPIVHHHEMMPQFADKSNRVRNWENIYAGMLLLSIGLAKKVILSDNLSPVVRHAFDVTPSLSFVEALLGSLAYTLQLYFDFSGYSDMAVGAALFFNIKLPFNFDSPYKSKSIQEFWRKWHITLSIWLRDYLYIPLGGSRCSKGRTLLNLFITMTLGGLWHGAAWTYVIWGMLHGAALVINRVWHDLTKNLSWTKKLNLLWWFLTSGFVNCALIIFRAKDFACIKKFAEAFFVQPSFELTTKFKDTVMQATKFSSFSLVLALIVIAFCVAVFSKNSIWMVERKDSKVVFVFSALCLLASMFCLIFPDNSQEFIYFQF